MLTLPRIALASLMVPALLTATETYHVLNRDGTVARIPADGSAASKVPDTFGATGFAIDSSGNYIVATGFSLIQLTPAGKATLIANPPTGGQMIDVAIDANGNYIVADNANHLLLRVNATSHQVSTIAAYPADPQQLEDAYVRIDSAGNYILAEDSDSLAHIFRITPAGNVTAIPLTGTIVNALGGFTIDASGNYVVTTGGGGSLVVYTPAGVGHTLISNATLQNADINGLTRDPTTGNFIVVGRLDNTVYLVSADGSRVASIFSGDPLNTPVAVLISGATASTPAPVSANSAGGSGPGFTFTFTFSDTGGWQNLSVVNVLFNAVLDGRQACYIAFVPSGPSSGMVYLVDDGGDSGGPYSQAAIPGNGTAQNSQCNIVAGLSSVHASGTTLTVTLNVNFNSSFMGYQVTYMAAGEPLVNSGWQPLGTWYVTGPGQPALSVNTVVGHSTGATRVFNIDFDDTKGWQDIAVANILINGAIDGRNACFVAYVPTGAASGMLYLVDNAGDSGGPFVSTVIPGGAPISNSQCTVGPAATPPNASGNELDITLSFTLNHSFAGNRIVYAATRSSNATSGWEAIGTVVVP